MDKAYKFNIRRAIVKKLTSSKSHFRFKLFTLNIEGFDISDIPEFMSNSVNFTRELPSPRCIKTHLPFQFWPKQVLVMALPMPILMIARGEN